MRIVCYGDSNTYGYDPRSFFGGRYPAESRWTDILAELSGNEVLNEGQNGREIPRGEEDIIRAAERIARYHADLVIVMLGSNDILRGADAQTAAVRMERFAEKLKREQNRILLIAPPPMQYGEWASEERILRESSRLSAEYRLISEKLGIGFADAGEWQIGISYDGVHFSEEGHSVFANNIITVMETV